jgi:hypothetical protein
MQISIAITVGTINSSNKLFGPTQQLINAFKARVVADGGIFEAEACLQKTLAGLGGISSYEGFLISNFQQRVLYEGGIFEAESCLNTTLTNLNNIQ